MWVGLLKTSSFTHCVGVFSSKRDLTKDDDLFSDRTILDLKPSLTWVEVQGSWDGDVFVFFSESQVKISHHLNDLRVLLLSDNGKVAKVTVGEYQKFPWDLFDESTPT